MTLKELMEALRFICTVSFWRMVFLWTFPLIISYIKLLNLSIFSKKPIYHHCAVLPLPSITSVSTSYKTSGRRLPICIITGLSTLQYRRIDFEEFCAATINIYQLKALDRWYLSIYNGWNCSLIICACLLTGCSKGQKKSTLYIVIH